MLFVYCVIVSITFFVVSTMSIWGGCSMYVGLVVMESIRLLDVMSM